MERGLCLHTIVRTLCPHGSVWSNSGIQPLSQTVSEKPFLALALPPTPETALAASVDRSVTLFDLRTGTSAAVAVKFPHPTTPATLVFAQSSGTQSYAVCERV